MLQACSPEKATTTRQRLLEVEGNFLYLDEVQAIVPPNASPKDSAEIAQGYIRKWVTDVLLYQNAKRNITNKAEIEKLLEEYRKSLILHQYQQKLLQERLPAKPTDEEITAFYESYSSQFELRENVIKGILLVVPINAPNQNQVRNWLQSANTASLEKLDKYSMQHAISYDFFMDRWTSFNDIQKRLPLPIPDQTSFLNTRRFVETNDSTRQYFLKISETRLIGQTEPIDLAKPRIINLIMSKLKSDFIANFESEIYNDAIKNETITFFEKKK